MRARSWFAAMGLLLLPGCSPPGYDIVATVSGREVTFTAVDHSSWGGDDLHAATFQVRDRERIVWLIEAGEGCPVPKGPWPFPLVYGRLPPCFTQIIAARPLREGALYRADGDGGLRHGSGYFRLERSARNYEWEEVDAEMQSWPSLSDPRYPVNQRSAAPPAAESNAAAK